ncbi:hypothetical protein [Hafnia paralvei]|uniref:hypothetical protein n=1 Tax=Hafnia paralvei TaxID=546367 RepID=UPI00141A4C0E|nr:hypothetical protein [Hafnia paralvei]NIH29459.1 hypothetical protein [Hafnia paralvei]
MKFNVGYFLGYAWGIFFVIPVIIFFINIIFLSGHRVSEEQINHYIDNSVQLVLKVPNRHEKGSYKVDYESESYLRSFSGAGLNFMRGYTFYDEQYKKYFKIITFDGFPTLKIHGENGAVIRVIDENTQRYSTLGGFNLKATVNAVQWKNPEYGSKANPYPVFAHDVILIPPTRDSWAATIEGFKITDSLNVKFVREYLNYFISKKELISLELDKG